jgi:hypothetical protein
MNKIKLLLMVIGTCFIGFILWYLFVGGIMVDHFPKIYENDKYGFSFRYEESKYTIIEKEVDFRDEYPSFWLVLELQKSPSTAIALGSIRVIGGIKKEVYLDDDYLNHNEIIRKYDTTIDDKSGEVIEFYSKDKDYNFDLIFIETNGFLFVLSSLPEDILKDFEFIGEGRTCEDSDGLDYYVKGTALSCDFATIEETGSDSVISCAYHPDFCLTEFDDPTGKKLMESYCEGNEYKAETYVCPNGCKDGACLLGIDDRGISLIDKKTAAKYGGFHCAICYPGGICAFSCPQELQYKENGILINENSDYSIAIVVDDKLALIVKEDDKQFVVYGGEESRRYDKVTCLREVGGKLVYHAHVKDGKDGWYDAEIIDGEVLKYDGSPVSAFGMIEYKGILIYATYLMRDECTNRNCWIVVIGDRKTEFYDYILSDSLELDGETIIFKARAITGTDFKEFKEVREEIFE